VDAAVAEAERIADEYVETRAWNREARAAADQEWLPGADALQCRLAGDC